MSGQFSARDSGILFHCFCLLVDPAAIEHGYVYLHLLKLMTTLTITYDGAELHSSCYKKLAMVTDSGESMSGYWNRTRLFLEALGSGLRPQV